MKINHEHLYNKILEMLVAEAGEDKQMKSYLLQGGFDTDIEEFVDSFVSAACDQDEDGVSDEEFNDKEDEP